MLCIRYVSFGIIIMGCWELSWNLGFLAQGFVSYGYSPKARIESEYSVMVCTTTTLNIMLRCVYACARTNALIGYGRLA